MKKRAVTKDNYFVQLLDERFERLHERLDQLEGDRTRRDVHINLLDTTNKAEIKAVKDQVMVVAGEVTRLKWLLQAACWCIATGAAAISWAVGLWNSVETAMQKALS